jgi:plasmid maintenance system antidote protein VapI
MSEDFWIGLQMDYDAAKTKDTLAKTLANIKPWPRKGAHLGVSV